MRTSAEVFGAAFIVLRNSSSVVQIVVPAAISGLAAAFILALSRAVGETMIVALASGAGPALTANPLRAAETMTGHIVRISGGDLSYDTIDYNSLFAIAAVLFFGLQELPIRDLEMLGEIWWLLVAIVGSVVMAKKRL